MPVDIEQWHAETGDFNGCSQLSVVKLYLNMRNLMNNMFFVLICTFALSAFCLKFYVFSYLTKVHFFFGLNIFFYLYWGLFVADFVLSLRAHLFTDHFQITNT